MSPFQIPAAVESHGASLRADQDHIVISRANVLPPELLAAIRENKPTLLGLLRQPARNAMGARIHTEFLQRLPQGEREQYESTVRALDAGQDPKEGP